MSSSLNILTPATARGRAWIAAITAAAEAQGWTIMQASGCADAKVVRLADTLPGHEAPADWIILTDHPRAIWSEAAGAGDAAHPQRDVLSMTSIRLAAAAEWVEAGARAIDAAGDTIDLPGLGVLRLAETNRDHPMVEDPALDLYALLPPPVGAKAHWRLAHFSYPVGHGFDGGTPEIDLTGRARILVHGPYVQLPPGVWEVRFEFAIDPMGKPLRFRFDWGVGDDMVTCNPTIHQAGRYSITLSRRWLESGPAQARIWMMQGTFDGHFEFHGCTVSRLADDETDRDIAA